MGKVAQWMVNPMPEADNEAAALYRAAQRMSADEIMINVNLPQLWEQKHSYMDYDIKLLSANHARSVMYQVDLAKLADYISQRNLDIPEELPEDAPVLNRMRNLMFRARLTGSIDPELEAWRIMRKEILHACTEKSDPRIDVMSDQIVWGRSPVRIDLAGGWSDTPPYSLCHGGTVLNMAVELNGQAPLQAFVKPCLQPHIVLRSIDLGASETVTTYAELEDYARIGSPFSIPKAALALAGFSNDFSVVSYPTLRNRLESMGGGLEITLLSAVGAGSGLGTSSILAATVLSALNDFCALGWDTSRICRYTLALEQLLTTGGGWQDQYGGVLSGIKLLQSTPGMSQDVAASWLPSQLFADAEYAPCHILYYTGITRTAKTILADIVRDMTLNSGSHLAIIADMKQLAKELAVAVQRRDWMAYGEMVRRSWQLNKRLDSGTSPESVEQLTRMIDRYAAGYKLPGAGGGGYLYIVAHDPYAASKIREILTNARPNSRARIVEMRLSDKGTQISRS
ncbi:MAG: bifunctional fucokinase/L-fucose-1-P-guanylyltransferase, partial [Paramuribaculum sp.]|nr:bifunctional fucokinase/L-fucose-1-P-guanylyltransferase [Paramuribaculum sp.]